MTPSQIQWSGTVRRLRVAEEEEERRSRQASENAPPAVVFHEEMADMVNGNQHDGGGFQPVGVVNDWRCARIPTICARRMRGVVHL